MSKDQALLGLKRKDKETGLHYNRYRYYEPYSARYMSKDPIGLFGGLNNSAYVSDPNQWIDPMGLMAKSQKEKMAANNASVLKNKANETQLVKSKWGVTKVSDYWIGQQKIYNQPVPKSKKEPYSGGLLGGYKIPSKYNEKKSKYPSGKCNIEIDYLICAGSYYVGSGSVGLNVHKGNIYGGIGITKASYDKLSGKSAIGAGCLGFLWGNWILN